jgi:DNA-directed RNA polymerase subunit L
MEIQILEEGKTKVKFKVIGRSHTVCNLLRKELANDKAVEFAGYNVEHPLIDEAVFTVSTTRKDPMKAVSDAVGRIRKNLSDFKSEAKKI